MSEEDYSKYYIQGSDHYLIPKDVFDELFDEMENWKEEAKELKKQLTTYQILHRDCKVDNLKNISKIEEMENQQKEFVEYLEEEIKKNINWYNSLTPHDKNYYYKDYVDKDTNYMVVLSKYKEIIGGNDV